MKIIELKNKLGEIIIPKKWEPIGKILTFDREMEMSKYYYGTWELTLKERSPIGINPDSTDDRFKTAGNQFGEKEHTLKIEEMPKHSHKTGISGTTFYSGTIGYDTAQVKVEQTSGLNTASTGGDKPHNNIHPVEIVYFYKRVA
ncbi:MAG: hypothetical protein J6K45_04260 [Clostridia bacterium]|nr:hypothetical protein [Clostridia bacterium]